MLTSFLYLRCAHKLSPFEMVHCGCIIICIVKLRKKISNPTHESVMNSYVICIFLLHDL